MQSQVCLYWRFTALNVAHPIRVIIIHFKRLLNCNWALHDSRTIQNQLDEYCYIHTHAKAPKYNHRHFHDNSMKWNHYHTISHPVLRDWYICKYFTEMTQTHNRTCEDALRTCWFVIEIQCISEYEMCSLGCKSHTTIPWLHYACICF